VKREDGWTLIELLFVLAILAVILAGIFELFQVSVESWRRSYHSTLAREEASRALNLIKKDLREATPLTDEPAINYAHQNKLIFYSNVDPGDPPEKVEYVLSGSNFLRKVTQPDTTQPPYAYTGSPQVTTLTVYCRNETNHPLFLYFSSTTETLSNLPLSLNDRQSVKIVRINLRIDIDTERPPETKEWRAEVTLRNVD
jgi:prepilin-type N-terminal cleavage/methylation domain-containing protein